MNFEFSDDQKMIKEEANKFLTDKCDSTEVRRILDGDDSDGVFDANVVKSEGGRRRICSWRM